MRPVYSVVPTDPMDESTATELKGYRGDGPVRIGNAAAAQVQHDTYGSVILAAMPMFFDRRLPRPGDEGLFRLLETLGAKAGELALKPTTASGNIAGASASTRIRRRCAGPAVTGSRRSPRSSALHDRAAHWDAAPSRSMHALLEGAWNEKRQAFTAAFGSDDLDASVLLLPDLGVIEADDPRFVSTVKAIERELCARSTLCATRRPTISACRRRHS